MINRTDKSGFTLVEVLMVVAMLGILAAMAAPALFRARLSGNEASAIGSLRSIVNAQFLYASSCADGYFAPSLSVLGQPPANGTPFLGPDLTYGDTVVKSGYTVTIGSTSGAAAAAPASCNGVVAGQGTRAFWATATPAANSGTRAFGVNALGTIYFAVQLTPLVMTDTAAPAGARPIPE
jgi:prepilin-type N-terminal cleavage/methylation domain-containing protein